MLSTNEWIRVPIGVGSEPYRSMPFERTILVVARTATTTSWLLDVLADVIADTRIQIIFTVEDEAPSVYHRGARELLGAIAAAVMPWSQATSTRFDLAVSSSFNGSLSRLLSPLLITLHGPGIGKPASVLPGGLVPLPRVTGMSASPATTVVLSHEEQTQFFPNQADVELVVAGDPCLDRLVISLPRRARYREAFGVTGSERIVALTSTWGTSSQIATLPQLSLDVVESLPTDDWRVSMVIHPNVWHGHSRWQVRAWLSRAADAGVLLVPPDHDEWQAMIVAADLIIADHGSVGLYAAAIGRPVMTAAFGHDQVVAGVPLAELGQRAPSLDLNGPLRPQLDRALSAHRPGDFGDLAARVSARPGQAAATIASTLYRLVGLTPPTLPPSQATIRLPSAMFAALDAQLVVAEVERGGAPMVTLERFPVARDAPLLPVASSTSSCTRTRGRRSCCRTRRSSSEPRHRLVRRHRGPGPTVACWSTRAVGSR